MKFTGICLITHDVLGLTNFYKRILGIEAEGNEIHAEIKTQGASMTEVFSVQGMEEMAPDSMQGAGYGSFTIGFEVEDVDVEYEKLNVLGIEFIKLPTTHQWGTRSFWFRDPDGNIVNFYSNVA